MSVILTDGRKGLTLIPKDYADSNVLVHHGVKGQKHGVRQYQYENGGLTPLGYIHYKEMYGWGDKKPRKYKNEPDKVSKNRDVSASIIKRSAKFNADKENVKLIDSKIDELYDKQLDAITKSSEYLKNGESGREESDRYYQLYESYDAELDKARAEFCEAVEKLGETAGIGKSTLAESTFVNSAVEYVYDKKAMSELQDRLKDADPDEIRLIREKQSELENSINEFDAAEKHYSDQWSKDNPGKEWDGDGTEFYEELLSKYPEYKKIDEKHDRIMADYIKSCMRLIKSEAFKDLKYADKYVNYFACTIDPKSHDEWYSFGDIAAYALAIAIFPKWNEIDFVDPMFFVENYDKNGKSLGNPRLRQ